MQISWPMVNQAGALGLERPVIVRRPNRRNSIGADLRTLVSHVDLFWTLTAHRIRVRYKQSVLGVCWALLQPVGLMLIFSLVFGRIAQVPSEGVPYSLFAYSGLLLWSFFATAVGSATHALVAHGQLITKIYFPREILPLTYVAAALFDLFIGGAVLGGLLLYNSRPIGWSILYAIPAVVTVAALVTAAALLLSAWQVRFRDIGLAVPLLLYLWMFSTPIAYPLSRVPAAYRSWFMLNPLTGVVESFRGAVVHGAPPDPGVLGVPVLMAAVLLPVAYVIFKRVEATMADVI